ncbi:MAG: hypothetical protein AB1521_04435 [Bacteroidota bacterium]
MTIADAPNQQTNKKYVFFLGGNDAEMETIRQLLIEQKQKCFDKHLTWGAKLSEYQSGLSQLTQDETPVLVELKLDIPYPANAIIVDHHNECAGADKKTSIEQIAELLNIKLDRWQQLISANDKAYIEGMKVIGASQEEIDMVRKFDRRCQGIMEDDEILSLESIKHHSKILTDNAILVNSLISKTSAITDYLYLHYKHIFITTPDKKLVYSSCNKIIQKLIDRYKELKEVDNAVQYWYGGNLPFSGYFGANQKLEEEEIKQMIQEEIYSQHIFIFPFRVNLKNNNQDLFLKKVKNRYEKHIFWTFRQADFPKDIDESLLFSEQINFYNECKYFYDYVINSLYNNNADIKNETINLYYEHQCECNSKFVITLNDNRNNPYELEVEDLSLRFFDQGIGLLTIQLLNKKYKSVYDILKINDFGRRIYPQYLNVPSEKYPTPIDASKDTFFADSIFFDVGSINKKQDFTTSYFLKSKNQLAEYILELLRPLEYNEIKPIIDDRMFTLCWFGCDFFINNINSYSLKKKLYRYADSKLWYQYIFIDGKNPGIANKNMMRELNIKTTYDRFVELGTLYGLSRYSFVCLTNRSFFGTEIVRHHMKTLYYQIAVICLVQRASVIKFFKEIEDISAAIHAIKGEDRSLQKDLKEKVEELNKKIINFYDRFWFDEISAQEQGIELYQMLVRNSGIEQQIENLRVEIDELHNYVDMVYEGVTSSRIETLTRLGIIFLPFTLLAAIGAIEVYFIKIGSNAIWNNVGALGIFISSVVFVSLITNNLIKDMSGKRRKKRKDNKTNDENIYEDNPLKLLIRALKYSSGPIFWFLLWILFLLIYFFNK